MTLIEKRAWLTLWTMCPVYLVYFAIQVGWPDWPSGSWRSSGCWPRSPACTRSATSPANSRSAIATREDGLQQDERDDAIDARATRAAYFVLISGTILAGAIMPFTDRGWKVANTALLFIVLSETLRAVLTVRGYRRPALAH